MRGERREAERAVEATRARSAQAGAELASVNQFLRSAASAPDGTATLAGSLEVDPGYELALAAALGPRLSAALVEDLAAGERWLDRLAEGGGTALVRSRAGGDGLGGAPPPGAEALSEHEPRRRGRAWPTPPPPFPLLRVGTVPREAARGPARW